MTLRQRLLLQLALVLGLALLGGAALAYWRASGKISTELRAALTVGEQVIIDAVKEIERSPSPYQQMRIVIERFSGGRHLKVTLIDKDGARIAHSKLAQPQEPAPDWFYRLIAVPTHSARVALPKSVSGYSAFLIEADPHNESLELWEDLSSTLAVLALLSALAFSLVYWTIGRELTPLDNINAAFAKLATGDFTTRIIEGGSRDLKAVTVGFNQMVSRLEASEIAKAQLEEQLASVQEEERVELSRDLHDEIGPLLFSVSVDAASAQKALQPASSGEVYDRLNSIREAVSLSQKHVLEILGRLRSGTVEDLGLEASIANLISFWKARRPALTIRARVPHDGVGMALDRPAYRIVQESVSNAIKHGHPELIEIDISHAGDGSARLSIIDDGGGLTSEHAGRGQTGMRERVASVGGAISIRNRDDGCGVAVVAEFPPQRAQRTSIANVILDRTQHEDPSR